MRLVSLLTSLAGQEHRLEMSINNLHGAFLSFIAVFHSETDGVNSHKHELLHRRTETHGDAHRRTQAHADERRCTQTHADKRRHTQTNTKQTVYGVWADATSRRIQTLDVCSRTFGMYYMLVWGESSFFHEYFNI